MPEEDQLLLGLPEGFWYTVLGGALSLVGGGLTTLWVDYRSQLRHEEAVLGAIRDKLHNLFDLLATEENSDIVQRLIHPEEVKRIVNAPSRAEVEGEDPTAITSLLK